MAKRISQVIRTTLSIVCLLLPTMVIGHDHAGLKEFNLAAEQIKELKKSDLVQSLKQLTAYKDRLQSLSIEQNLLYFKLLTEIQIEQNKYSTAKKTANQGLIIAKGLTSPSILISELLYLKGFAFENLGDLPQAKKEYKKGLEVSESLHNKVQVAKGLINLGAIGYLTDDYERALVLLHDAYNIAGQTNDEELKGTANSELGIAYSYLLQDKQSMSYYQQSYSHFKKAGMLLAAHNSLNNIAITHIYNKNYQQAIDVFKTIITESNKDTPSDSMYMVYSGMAWAHLRKEEANPDAAYQYLLMAKQYLKFTEKVNFKLKYYIDEAGILYKLDRFNDVLTSIAEVERILSKHPDDSLIKKKNHIYLMRLKASVYNKQAHFKQAYETQSIVIALTDKLYENEDNRSIEQVRLRLEAEQADKKNEVLQKQQLRYEANLRDVKSENEEQRLYLIISALVALAFAWVLIKLIQSQHKLKIASNIDTLTGVANRRSLLKKSSEAFKLSKAKNIDLSILMIDIDHFKDINDNLGHSLSDKVLAKVGELGIKTMRKSDILGRFGSKEFMVCLPKTSLQSALEISERFRLCVSNYEWQFNSIESISVSIGVVSLRDDSDLISLIKRAEEQLHQAKASGKNKVCGQ